jgi:hypothetical protein
MASFFRNLTNRNNNNNNTNSNANSASSSTATRTETDDCCEKPQNDATYSIAEEIVKDKIAGDNLEDLKVLQGLRKDEVIVVAGSADQIENVFTKIHLPFTKITAEQLSNYNLLPEHTLYMNCHPSGYSEAAKQKVKKFVADGGLLITTDYVLNMLLTDIFPSTLHYGGEQTVDKSVPIQCIDDPYDEILKAFKGEKEWKLAGGSHPITIKDSNNVTVLIKSDALAKEYNGNGAILIRFQYMQGTVYHMISHFHLQHGGATSAAPSVQDIKASDYAQQKGATLATVQKMQEMELNKDISYQEVQNASVTTEMAYRAAMGQKKKFLNK